jgi:hypothetical protein
MRHGMRDEGFTLSMDTKIRPTSPALPFTLIGLHCHVQDGTGRELDLIFADKPYHDLEYMTYLEMVISLSLCSSHLTLSNATIFLTGKNVL